MIYMKLYEYFYLLDSGLQRKFEPCSDLTLTKLMFDPYNTNMIRATYLLLYCERLSTSSRLMISVSQLRLFVDVGWKMVETLIFMYR